MRALVEKLLRRYGSPITLQRSGEETAFFGFLNHTGSRSLQNMEETFEPLGQVPGGQYVLVAPLQPELKPRDTLMLGQKRYRIRRLEIQWYGKEKLLQWGLCSEEGGEEI